MGIEFTVYRRRIGFFGPERGCTYKEQVGNAAYTPYTTGSDLHYRMFATTFIITVVLKCYVYVYPHLNLVNGQMFVGFDQCTISSYGLYNEHASCRNNMLVTSCQEIERYLNNYSGFTQRIVLLSQDVESNPGPTDMEKVLSAIQATENRVLGELRSLKSEITLIKGDLVAVKNDQIQTRLNVNTIQKTQIDIKGVVTNLKK